MNIQLTDNQLIITWERTSATVHGEILDRLKRIRGAEFNKVAGCWSLPVTQADRLFLAFPKASYDYDAICAAVDAAATRIDRFMRNLRALGVQFEVQDGRVMALGPHVSPLVQQLVAGRNDAALAWLSEHPAEPAAAPAPAPQPLLDGEAVRQAALLAQSLRNAAKTSRGTSRGTSNGANTGI